MGELYPNQILNEKDRIDSSRGNKVENDLK